jgi:arginine-tRNA-protein transferase
MDQDKRLHRHKPLAMRLSMQSSCPYIAGETEQRIAVDIDFQPSAHDALAYAGFRRVENWVYKPACPSCDACTPWRVDTQRFTPSRSMARTISINSDLTRSITEARPTEQHYRLFKSYVTQRHDDGQMAKMNIDEFSSMISNSPVETMLMDYHDSQGQLLGSALTDIQQDGLSAVYSFFTPTEARRSIGTYMIIDMIKCAKELDLPWLYLGYYVKQSPKMWYKARFQPAEAFRDGEWQPYNSQSFIRI